MNKPLVSRPGSDVISERDSSDLASFIGLVSEARWLIVGITTAALVLGLVYVLVVARTYEADTTIQVLTQQAGGLTGLETLSALVEGTAIPTETEIEILQTRAVLLPVIHKRGMNIGLLNGTLPVIGSMPWDSCTQPAAVSNFEVPLQWQNRQFVIMPTQGGRYRLLDPNGYPVLDGVVGRPAAGRITPDADSAAGLAMIKVDSIRSCTNGFQITRVGDDEAVKSLLEQLSIKEIGQQTGLVQVVLRGKSAARVSTIVNDIANSNVKQNVHQNSEQAARQLNFLNSQFSDLEKRMQAAQMKLASFLTDHPTMAALSQNTQYLVTQAAALEQEIGPLEAQSAMAHAALGSQNPQLAALNAEMGALKKQRGTLLTAIAGLPKDEQTLVNLQTDVTTAQGLYTTMLNQVQTLQVAKAGTVGDVVIVDPAVTASRPIAPKKALDLGLSLIFGLVLGTGAAFGRRALSRGVDDPEQIEDQLAVPVHAVLLHSSGQRRLERSRAANPELPSLLAVQMAKDPTIEGLRSLRTSLQLGLPPKGRRIICFSSLSPDEGKSFVSSNLACLFAQTDMRVLLIDADLRRGHLNRAFGLGRGRGLAEVLAKEITVEQAVQQTKIPNFSIMTTGTLPKDASRLLASSDVGEVLEKCGDLFDFVVVDSPPILAVADAYVVAQHCTYTVLVIKYGLHGIRQLRRGINSFARNKLSVQSCVLNDVNESANRYAYRRYGYQYKYDYG